MMGMGMMMGNMFNMMKPAPNQMAAPNQVHPKQIAAPNQVPPNQPVAPKQMAATNATAPKVEPAQPTPSPAPEEEVRYTFGVFLGVFSVRGR